MSLPQRIYLIGFMGSGKSTLGRKLATAFSYTFIDTDSYIENALGMKIKEIFTLYGEGFFREQERLTMLKVSTMENVVVATGGGLACSDEMITLINNTGLSIYLKGSPEFLLSRIKSGISHRPLLSGKDPESLLSFIQDKLKEREGYYLKAKLTIEIPVKSVESIVKSIDSAE